MGGVLVLALLALALLLLMRRRGRQRVLLTEGATGSDDKGASLDGAAFDTQNPLQSVVHLAAGPVVATQQAQPASQQVKPASHLASLPPLQEAQPTSQPMSQPASLPASPLPASLPASQPASIPASMPASLTSDDVWLLPEEALSAVSAGAVSLPLIASPQQLHVVEDPQSSSGALLVTPEFV